MQAISLTLIILLFAWAFKDIIDLIFILNAREKQCIKSPDYIIDVINRHSYKKIQSFMFMLKFRSKYVLWEGTYINTDHSDILKNDFGKDIKIPLNKKAIIWDNGIALFDETVELPKIEKDSKIIIKGKIKMLLMNTNMIIIGESKLLKINNKLA